jgi:hypothetical protein
LAIVTEVLDPRLVDRVAAVADMLQIGSRSMQNTPLLVEAGRSGKPVLLKRGWSATLDEWLGAAEYVAREGNDRIVLCERGVRVPASQGYARAVLDLNVIQAIRSLTPLPVLVDPSHAAGRWDRVEPLARAALAASAHGLLIEASPTDRPSSAATPSRASSDGWSDRGWAATGGSGIRDEPPVRVRGDVSLWPRAGLGDAIGTDAPTGAARRHRLPAGSAIFRRTSPRRRSSGTTAERADRHGRMGWERQRPS